VHEGAPSHLQLCQRLHVPALYVVGAHVEYSVCKCLQFS
jgi:hypothetical protein